jgi:hypothetical protein
MFDMLSPSLRTLASSRRLQGWHAIHPEHTDMNSFGAERRRVLLAEPDAATRAVYETAFVRRGVT